MDSPEDLIFKELAQKLSLLLASEGVTVRTYAPGLPYFSQLSEERKKIANQNLGFYCDLCREHLAAGYALQDGSAFLWRALSKLGLVPRADLFQTLTKDSVIEIYSDDNVQLFRNINFFKYCSYTLEELHSREWWLLFHRDQSITDLLYAYASKVFKGELSTNFAPEIPLHVVRELESADMLVVEVQFDMMGPLYRNKRPSALIISETPRLIEA